MTTRIRVCDTLTGLLDHRKETTMEDAVVGTTHFKPSPVDLTDADRQLSSILHDRGYAVTDGRPLFHAAAEGLWDVFLSHLPDERIRQTYTCTACRRFVERYGDLVHVPEGTNQIRSVFWDPYGGPFDAALAAVRHRIEKSVIRGVFCPNEKQYGVDRTGPWEHFHVVPAKPWRPRNPLHKPHEEAAERVEDVKILRASLLEFSYEMARNALHLITTHDRFQRAEKVVGPAKWFFDVAAAYKDAVRHKDKEVVIWKAVATAPPGYPHIRSTMIGTLLEDLAAGLPIDVITMKFNAKMGPLAYQRPQAPPSDGQIARAEKVIAELGYVKSLERRFLRPDEGQHIWVPVPVDVPLVKPSGGVFAHLREQVDRQPDIEATTPTKMTWAKFARTVLPSASALELYTSNARGPYIALTTAVDPEAPPILQWDVPHRRNQVAWYVYTGGSLPNRWNLRVNTYNQVTGICQLPPQWYADSDSVTPAHWGDGVIFLLQDMKDLAYKKGALFFPETLRSELREIRSTLEAYAKKGVLAGADEFIAGGVDFRKGSNTQLRLRATLPTGRAEYLLDRWE